MSEYDSIYPNNSFAAKEKQKQEEKKVEKVVSGSVRKRKKSGAQKFGDVFLAEDVGNVKSYILMDVLVPALKKAISDIVTKGIDMVLYGESGKSRKGSSTGYSYSKYYEDDKYSRRTWSSSRGSYNYDDIILDSRSEAEEVLSSMDDIIDKYGIVSVADLYDLVGESSEYTDNKYGWTNIRSASVIRVRDGYKIKLPKARPLD